MFTADRLRTRGPATTRMAHVVTLALVLASGAGCASASDLTADSTCGAYLRHGSEQRHAAAARISTELRAFSAGDELWGPGVDEGCDAVPDTTLRTYFEGQSVFDVPGESMRRTLNVGDKVLVNKLAYPNGTPRRGEVVVFTAPKSWRAGPTEELWIKRVIGVAGDHVQCCDRQHRLVLNGHSLDEPYLYEAGQPSASGADFDVVVPGGRLWLMGDHRTHSGDSAEFYSRSRDINLATIAVDALVGRAVVVFSSGDPDRPGRLTVPAPYADIPDPPSHQP